MLEKNVKSDAKNDKGQETGGYIDQLLNSLIKKIENSIKKAVVPLSGLLLKALKEHEKVLRDEIKKYVTKNNKKISFNFDLDNTGGQGSIRISLRMPPRKKGDFLGFRHTLQFRLSTEKLELVPTIVNSELLKHTILIFRRSRKSELKLIGKYLIHVLKEWVGDDTSKDSLYKLADFLVPEAFNQLFAYIREKAIKLIGTCDIKKLIFSVMPHHKLVRAGNTNHKIKTNLLDMNIYQSRSNAINQKVGSFVFPRDKSVKKENYESRSNAVNQKVGSFILPKTLPKDKSVEKENLEKVKFKKFKEQVCEAKQKMHEKHTYKCQNGKYCDPHPISLEMQEFLFKSLMHILMYPNIISDVYVNQEYIFLKFKYKGYDQYPQNFRKRTGVLCKKFPWLSWDNGGGVVGDIPSSLEIDISKLQIYLDNQKEGTNSHSTVSLDSFIKKETIGIPVFQGNNTVIKTCDQNLCETNNTSSKPEIKPDL